MAVVILAAINPDNTAAGYNWTFAYPMLLFIIIAGILWYLFGRPHRRVPPRPISAAAGSRQPDATTARAAPVAGSMGASDEAAGAAGTTADTPAGETAPGYTATGDTAADDTAADDTGAQE